MTTAPTAPFERAQMLTLPSCTLFVSEVGEGEPIVFLHGNPDTHHIWSGVVERLKGKHRCIAPDLPGYGESTNIDDITLEGHAGVVRDLLDGLKLERVHLVIHDVGGPHGLAFASKWPERLLSLTIFNTNFFPDYKWHFWARMWRTPIVGELVMLLGTEGLFVGEQLKGAPKLPVQDVKAAWKRYSMRTRRHVVRWYRYMDSARHIGWDERMLKAIANVKRQVLWGDADPWIPKHTADRYGGDVHHFADLSHWVMAEDPDTAAKWIDALVTSSSSLRT